MENQKDENINPSNNKEEKEKIIQENNDEDNIIEKNEKNNNENKEKEEINNNLNDDKNEEYINKININEEKNKNEDEKNNNEKDDNQENENLMKDDDILNNRNFHFGKLRMNTEIEIDKIMAGNDESSNNIENLNNFLYDKEELSSEEDNLNENKQKINENDDNTDNLEEGEKKDSQIINARLNKLKDKTISYFEKIIQTIEKRYNDYINSVLEHIKKKELKISQVFQKDMENGKNIIEFAEQDINNQFDNIIEIHENILSAIEGHIDLLNSFLEQDLIQQKNPLEYFINNNSNEITNCWFLNKINYQKLNLSNVIVNKDLSELFSNYLCKKKDNKFASINIEKDQKGNLSLEASYVRENLKNLEKLKFTKLNSEEINLLLMSKKNQSKENNKEPVIPSANKLKSLTILESDFSTLNLSKISTPELIKLKIKKTPLPLSLKVFVASLIDKTSFLQKLYLQKCFLDDQSLGQIFEYLSEKPQIYESLKKISFLGNQITSVNMGPLLKKRCTFKSLEYLDFSKNSIYEFLTDNFKLLTQIKVLDLTDNNIPSHNFFNSVKSQKKKSSITLLSNNIFLNNSKENVDTYRKYLSDILVSFKYKIKKLNFSFLYDKNSINHFVELKISPMITISLVKLDLSYCGLSDQNVYNFLKNNYGLLNLKQLNLSNNFITIKIFNLLLKLEQYLEKLTSLDLSMNYINSLNIEDYGEIEKFIDKHSHLKKIKLQDSTFCQDLLILSQMEKEKCANINKKLVIREFKFIVEKEHRILIDPLKYLFEIKDKGI